MTNPNNIQRILVLEWKGFLSIVLAPWPVILVLSTAALVHFSSDQSDKTISAILSVAIALCSGLLGGVVARKWLETTETQVLVARGKSAIRNLKVLLTSIGNLERRVSTHLDRFQDDDLDDQVIETYLEEVVEQCNNLQEETVNALEDSVDIIPEVDVTTQIGNIGALKNQIAEEKSEVSSLKEDLDSLRKDQKESTRAYEDVSKQLADEEEQLRRAKADLERQRTSLGNVITTATATGAPPVRLFFSVERNCPIDSRII